MAGASTSGTPRSRAGHLIERFRLFLIIALGETVLTTANALAGEPFELERLLALTIGFAGAVALWWCYFQRAEWIGVEVAEAGEDAAAVGLWGTWTLTLIVLALIGIAVGDELAIAHPGDDARLGFTILHAGACHRGGPFYRSPMRERFRALDRRSETHEKGRHRRQRGTASCVAGAVDSPHRG